MFVWAVEDPRVESEGLDRSWRTPGALLLGEECILEEVRRTSLIGLEELLCSVLSERLRLVTGAGVYGCPAT